LQPRHANFFFGLQNPFLGVQNISPPKKELNFPVPKNSFACPKNHFASPKIHFTCPSKAFWIMGEPCMSYKHFLTPEKVIYMPKMENEYCKSKGKRNVCCHGCHFFGMRFAYSASLQNDFSGLRHFAF
jgi:hypothetical protein